MAKEDNHLASKHEAGSAKDLRAKARDIRYAYTNRLNAYMALNTQASQVVESMAALPANHPTRRILAQDFLNLEAKAKQNLAVYEEAMVLHKELLQTAKEMDRENRHLQLQKFFQNIRNLLHLGTTKTPKHV